MHQFNNLCRIILKKEVGSAPKGEIIFSQKRIYFLSNTILILIYILIKKNTSSLTHSQQKDLTLIDRYNLHNETVFQVFKFYSYTFGLINNVNTT